MLQVGATGIRGGGEEEEGMLCIIKLRLLPSTSFPIHHSLINIPFDAIQSELLIASLHESLINKTSKFNIE
jgi:hypothetical protein